MIPYHNNNKNNNNYIVLFLKKYPYVCRLQTKISIQKKNHITRDNNRHRVGWETDNVKTGAEHKF